MICKHAPRAHTPRARAQQRQLGTLEDGRTARAWSPTPGRPGAHRLRCHCSAQEPASSYQAGPWVQLALAGARFRLKSPFGRGRPGRRATGFPREAGLPARARGARRRPGRRAPAGPRGRFWKPWAQLIQASSTKILPRPEADFFGPSLGLSRECALDSLVASGATPRRLEWEIELRAARAECASRKGLRRHSLA